MIHLPAMVLPKEFIELLKNPSSSVSTGNSVITQLNNSQGLMMVMEKAFSEFNENNIGLDKVYTSLGWTNFRDRLASVYIFKALNGSFPDKTDVELVKEIITFERRFKDKEITGSSRIFLLGLYLRFFNIYLSLRENHDEDVYVSAGTEKLLALSPLRTDRPDWMILILWHLDMFLGTDSVKSMIAAGFSWEKLYKLLNEKQKFHLVSNLLSYGASIQEDDPFLYERI
ncbi:MAG: hypothetical protein K2P81_13875 [Bacteriovoracaceae bacterium]|nr:hypothetical protein [Bacteriovoracaceae bacterium]